MSRNRRYGAAASLKRRQYVVAEFGALVIAWDGERDLRIAIRQPSVRGKPSHATKQA